jgi:hypothetical protein
LSNIQSSLNSLLTRAGQGDPVMLTVLQEIVDELERLGYIIDPAPETAEKITPAAPLIPEVVQDFRYEFVKTGVFLRWSPGTFDYQFYELRKGTNWNNASRLLVTNNIEVRLEPLAVGSHTYLLKTISIDGTPSEGIATLTFSVPTIGYIVIGAESSVNNILLRWSEPTSTFAIAYYIVQKNGNEMAKQTGTFFAYAEPVKATFKYTVIPVDIAGNIGPASNIVVDVAGFPDFHLQATIVSLFNQIKQNCIKDPLSGRLIVSINTTETIEGHFISRSWASPQSQVDAGYPVWITPVPLTAYYEEVFVFDLIYTNVIISLSWMFETLNSGPAPTFGIDARVSDDGVTYSPIVYTTQSFFAPSAKYVKVRMNFTMPNDKSLMAFSNYQIAISVRREQDAGYATAVAEDVNGTVVTFNKAFKDIDGITIAPMSTTTVIPIVDFLDVPNPTNFKVKIYDNAGVRKTVNFRWDARGVI